MIHMADGSWAGSLAERYLAVSLPRRWRHVEGVARRAGEASAMFTVEAAEILISAAFLHDIGYSPQLVRTGFHALDGARFLAESAVSHEICSLVAHHSCAYREAELRGLSASLSRWEDEGSPIRDALWWADMTTTPDGESTNVHDRIEEIQKRYGPEDLVTFFIRQAKSELVGSVERTEARLRSAGIDYTAK